VNALCIQSPNAILCAKSGRLLLGILTSPVICSSVTALQKRALLQTKIKDCDPYQ